MSKKKKKIKQKLKEGERRLVSCDGKLKKSNTLPNHIDPKQYYIKNTMIHQHKVKLQKRIYIYIQRERERERVITFFGREIENKMRKRCIK